MMISLIAAIGQNRELGLRNALLWHLKADLQNFKQLTMGHHILMGRKTFAAIGRALPGRPNLVLSLSADASAGLPAGVVAVRSPREAFALAAAAGETELFVIGGGQVYSELLPYAQRLYLSRVDFAGEADTFFPAFEHLPWRELERRDYPAASPSDLAWSYQVLEKQGKAWQT